MTKTEKVQKIIALALALNATKTEQEITGSKPTVFAYFLGHTAGLNVSVYESGWTRDNEPDYDRIIYLDEDGSENLLDKVIEKLTGLYNEWKEKETYETV